MKIDISTTIARIHFKNPVIVASGTFGYGAETADLLPLKKLGGIITKTITLKARAGNPPPRLAEVESGMLNTIGLQNIGFEAFAENKWDVLTKIGVPIIISVAGETAEDYLEMVRSTNKLKNVAAIELNLSCPNLKKRIICQNEELVTEIVSKAARTSKVPVIAKLSPQVASIAQLAAVVQNAGADAVSLVNTFPGMAINIHTAKPKLSTFTGGMSGPAIKPLALKCVWDAARSVTIPVIGGGGIMTGDDAVEFMMAGAGAVTVGTANFIDPMAPVRISEEIAEFLKLKRFTALKDIMGKLK